MVARVGRLVVKPPKSQNSERAKPPKSEYPTGIKLRNLIPPKSQFTERLLIRLIPVLFPRIVITLTYRSPESPKSRTVPEVSLLRNFLARRARTPAVEGKGRDHTGSAEERRRRKPSSRSSCDIARRKRSVNKLPPRPQL